MPKGETGGTRTVYASNILARPEHFRRDAVYKSVISLQRKKDLDRCLDRKLLIILRELECAHRLIGIALNGHPAHLDEVWQFVGFANAGRHIDSIACCCTAVAGNAG